MTEGQFVVGMCPETSAEAHNHLGLSHIKEQNFDLTSVCFLNMFSATLLFAGEGRSQEMLCKRRRAGSLFKAGCTWPARSKVHSDDISIVKNKA